jgi:hypothetical protein
MNFNQAVSVLNREKELLTQVVDLAECQLELIESGRLEDLEVLLSLRAKPMAQLSDIEIEFGDEMPQGRNNLSANENYEFEELNNQIITMANRIIEIDEKAEQLAEERDCVISWPF